MTYRIISPYPAYHSVPGPPITCTVLMLTVMTTKVLYRWPVLIILPDIRIQATDTPEHHLVVRLGTNNSDWSGDHTPLINKVRGLINPEPFPFRTPIRKGRRVLEG